MMSKKTYRSKHDVLKSVLKSVEKPRNKTFVMYEARLSFVQLQSYLEFTMRKGLVQFNKEKKTYSLTENGKRELVALNGLHSVDL